MEGPCPDKLRLFPDGFDISDEELLELVTRIVHERRPDASCVVTFDSGFSSPERPAEQL